MIKRIAQLIVPRRVRTLLKTWMILGVEFGQWKTIWRQECIDRHNNPIPWYTYPATEYLKQIDFSEKAVFEYGSGYSTLFWASRCKTLVSVEDNPVWYEKINKCLPRNVEYNLLTDRAAYVGAISRCPNDFDVIIIDCGEMDWRYECAQAARHRLKDDGLIILDNSDWNTKTSRFLRDSDLIEVDMSGFSPINSYTSTTSFYFSRGVRLSPGDKEQPKYGIGSMRYLSWKT